jgi:hypothetical protein
LLLENYLTAQGDIIKGKTPQWRIDPENFSQPENPTFMPGSVDFSPAWFAQGHEVSIIFLVQYMC